MPTLSIGMPVYNRPDYLELSIDNLRHQTFQDLEILIADNASPDPRVAEICEEKARVDPRIRYLRRPVNIGAAKNFIDVFDQTRSEFFAWASDDDLRDRDFFRRGVLALSKSKAGAWFCQIENINSKGEVFRTYPSFKRFQSTAFRSIDLIRYLWEPEVMGKANPFYSVFRRERLAPIVDLFRQDFSGWGSDMVFIYAFLCRNDLLIDDKIMMQKRVEAEGSWAPKIPREYIYPWPEREAYFANYVRVAKRTPYFVLTHLVLALRHRYDRWFHRRMVRILRKLQREAP